MNFDKGKRDLEVKHLNEQLRADFQEFYNTSPYTLMDVAKSSGYLSYEEVNEFILEERDLSVMQMNAITIFMDNH